MFMTDETYKSHMNYYLVQNESLETLRIVTILGFECDWDIGEPPKQITQLYVMETVEPMMNIFLPWNLEIYKQWPLD